jgi:hypothetical protein
MKTPVTAMKRALSLGMLLLVPAALGLAGEQTNVRGMGMGRTSVAVSRGLDAVGLNPANLAMEEDGRVILGILPVGVRFGTNMMNYGTYREYFTGVATDAGREPRYLTEADKQSILGGFPDGVGRLSGDVEVRPISLALHLGNLGSLALSMTDRFSVSADIPHEYAEFVLYGNPAGSAYDFSSTRMVAQWTREYALSYARTLRAPAFLSTLAVGLGVKYVQGFGYASMAHTNTNFATGTDGILRGRVAMEATSSGIGMLETMGKNSVTPFPAPAGTGWGVDLGATGEVNKFLTVGVSVTDIGSLRWNHDLERTSVDSMVTMDDPTSEGQRKAIEEAFRGTRGAGESFVTPLPTTLRVGGVVQLDKIPAVNKYLIGTLTLAADVAVGFQDVPGTSTHPRVALGMEFRPVGFLPLRTGYSFGGGYHPNFALGFGLCLWALEIDAAAENLAWMFNNDALDGASIAFGLRLRI